MADIKFEIKETWEYFQKVPMVPEELSLINLNDIVRNILNDSSL